ncbi:MAG: cytochrome c oxidase subunit II [Chromatiales bacterium]|nr:cytochrome c oxidase subunit II [Chromatiales bacterium]
MAINLIARRGGFALSGATTLLAWSAGAHAEFALNMPRGVTAISRDVYDLHMLIFWICVVIGVAVFGVMFYSIVTITGSRSGAVPAHVRRTSTMVEIIWTVIPVLILVAHGGPGRRRRWSRIDDTRDADLTVKVTGYQWKWQYEYLDEGVVVLLAPSRTPATRPASSIRHRRHSVENYLLEVDNPLVVPVGKKVRILITAADVIHAWWVPDFGMEEGRHSRLTSTRCWITDRQARRLPRPVRRAVRPATTASCRSWSRS